VLLSTLDGISHLRIYLPKELRTNGSREAVWKSILEVQRRSPDGIPLLDPIENMEIKDEKFKVLVKVKRHPYGVSVPHQPPET
jgi:ATP-dependent RNA helicase DOB1